MEKTKKELEAEIKELKAKLSAKNETSDNKEGDNDKPEVKKARVIIEITTENEKEEIAVISEGLSEKGLCHYVVKVANRLMIKELSGK